MSILIHRVFNSFNIVERVKYLTILVLVFSFLIVVIDQVLKHLSIAFLKPIGSVTVISNLLDLIYVENEGAAFGIFANQRWIFISFTFIAIAFVLYLLFAKKIKNKLFLVSSTLIIGGGIGNLIDRIFLGYVVDYIRWSFFPAICNFADYCISLGTILLMIYIVFFLEDKDKIKK